MDIIVDTNILRQDHFMRSPKLQAVSAYLNKTRSHLIIPTIVKDEMIAIFRRTLVERYDKLKNQSSLIDEWCYDNTPRTEIRLDINEEVSTYESFLLNFLEGGGGLELPYQDRFLGDVVRSLNNKRLYNRKRLGIDKGCKREYYSGE